MKKELKRELKTLMTQVLHTHYRFTNYTYCASVVECPDCGVEFDNDYCEERGDASLDSENNVRAIYRLAASMDPTLSESDIASFVSRTSVNPCYGVRPDEHNPDRGLFCPLNSVRPDSTPKAHRLVQEAYDDPVMRALRLYLNRLP